MENTLNDTIVSHLQKIMTDRGLNQSDMALYAGVSASHYSKILQGKVKLSLKQLSNLATGLSLRDIDIITYPDIYIKKEDAQAEDHDKVKAVLQVELLKEKKDKVLKLIFGEEGFEVLNKE